MSNRNNFISLVAGEAFWGMAMGLVLTSTVLAVFLKENGAGLAMIGSISSIESGVGGSLQLVGLFLFTSRRKRKHQVLGWHLYAVVPFLLMNATLASAASHLPPVVVRWSALMFYGGYMAALGVVGGAFMDWLAHVFSERERGTVLGTSICFAGLASMGGSILAGRLIRLHPAPNAYAYLYFGAAMTAIISVLIYWRVDDSPLEQTEDSPRPTSEDVKRYLHASLSNLNFRCFLVSRSLATIGFCMVPFITVHFMSSDGGGLSSDIVVTCGSAIAVGWAASSFVFGRLGDRAGHAIGLFLGLVIQVATLAVLLWGGGKWGCVTAFAGAGVCLGAGLVSYYNALMETCPHDNRFAHITIGNFIIGLVGIIAPLLGGIVAERWGVRTLFMSCFTISIIGLVWHALFVREPRRELSLAEMLLKM